MKLLFLCVANSARSQMAEGLARTMFPDWTIQSAGSKPSKLNPDAIYVMRELGIDISGHFSKSMSELPNGFLRSVDYVITLCEDEVCPVLPSSRAQKLHWPFADPAGHEHLSESERHKRFRTAREAIKNKLKTFREELAL